MRSTRGSFVTGCFPVCGRPPYPEDRVAQICTPLLSREIASHIFIPPGRALQQERREENIRGFGMNNPLYDQKEKAYFSVTREELISLVPEGIERLLDVGCADGSTALAAKQRKNIREVAGIEFHPPAAAAAKEKLDLVLQGDIESLEPGFPESHFDCIICADVLEHTKDPWAVLRKLRPFLRADGLLIASIPNFRHLHPLLKILFNRFEYMESGLLDKTHLRIFTLHTIRKMFEDEGFRIVDVRRIYSSKLPFRLARIASLGLLRPLTVYQFIIVSRKKERW